MVKKVKLTKNVVRIDSRNGFIDIKLRGPQTEAGFKKVSLEHSRLIEQIREEGGNVFVMLDASALHENDLNSEVRSEMRAMTSRDIDGVAIVAKGQLFNSLMSSTKIAAPSFPVQYFTRRRPAELWLRESLKEGWTYPLLALIAAVLIAGIGVLALIGWGTNNDVLRSFLPSQRPINPMAAVGLLDIGVVFFAYYWGWLTMHRVAGLLSILLGIVALSPLPVDTLLFAHQIALAGAHTQIADTAAVCFICVGICSLISATSRIPFRIIGYGAVLTIVGLASFNIYGQLYAHDFIYGISGSFVMAFNLATAFLIAAAAGTLLLFRRHQINLLAKVSPLGWLIIIALVALQIGGYADWNQQRHRDRTEATQSFTVQSTRLSETVNSRIDAYTNALLGFQGFYAASDTVTQHDFSTYYNSLHLDASYPGLRSMAFIAAAKTSGIPALVKNYRSDTSLFPGGNPGFTVGPLANEPIHFFALYYSNYTGSAPRYTGTDIATIPGREAIYTAALQSDTPRASGTITFLQSANQAATVGFFIIVPVHTSLSSTPIGVVNANFAYDSFFPKVFGTEPADNDLSVRIRDGNQVIYQSSSYGNDQTSPYHSSITIPIANYAWTMDVAADSNYGVTTDKQRTQLEIISSLVALSILLLIMFYIQSRTRRRAVVMANEMTSDLQHERQKTMEANQKDEAIITSIGDGLVAFDTAGIVERNNHVAERLFGMGEGELVGKNLAHFTHAYTLEGTKLAARDRPYALALRHKKPLSMKLYYERTDGMRFPVELSVSPIILNGKVTGAIEVFRDITVDIQLDRAKSEFVSLASHQLRTPLSAINWYSEILLNGDSGKLNKEQEAYVKEIFNGNARMIELVNALLDVSRLDLGRMTFTPEEIDLHQLIDGLKNELKVMIDTKHMKMVMHIDESVRTVVNDRKMVQMIVQNLMSNALKYTNEGGQIVVTLRPATTAEVEHVHLPASEPHVLFSVADNGFGIPLAQQKRIFEKMFRADNVQATDVEGTGLGLYIVKEVALQMGGWIGFESIEEKGSTFTVIVPVVAKETTEKKTAA